MRLRRWYAAAVMLIMGMILHPAGAMACSSCFGQSDSPLAEGMNWGIFSLLAVVIFVLSGFATLFVYLARRARRYDAAHTPAMETGNF